MVTKCYTHGVTPVFIPQDTLNIWSDEGKVELNNQTLLLPIEKTSIELQAAVHIKALEEGCVDVANLLGKVKTVEQLKGMGAEHYMDSVIHGDAAYKVVEGFKGLIISTSKSTPAPVSGIPRPADDADILSEMFLNTRLLNKKASPRIFFTAKSQGRN